jgi:uncharacterized protein
MRTFAISYRYTDDRARLERLLPAHRAYVAELADRGLVLMSGPLGADESPGALFIVAAGSRAEAESFAARDPLVGGGPVSETTIVEWVPKLGRLTAAI